MLKKAILERNLKRIHLVYKYSLKRFYLKQYIKKYNNIQIIKLFQKMPRNTNKIRIRNRCWYTGRSRGYLRFFGLSRISLREFFHEGKLPGVIKMAW